MLANKSVFLKPDALSAPSAWLGHIPFAFWIVEALKPNVLVELGTHYGHSYFAFCKSVLGNALNTQCYAVDTWQGDEHAGQYGEDIFAGATQHNNQNYSAFSRLLRMTFEQAASYFSDGSIDLLHIDGLHTYEAVKHDFETWLPKVSKRGVILFHDTNVREREFGVWRLWEELSAEYPSIEFHHSHGLGVLFVGDEYPEQIDYLLTQWKNAEEKSHIRNFFSRIGEAIEVRRMLDERQRELIECRKDLDESRASLEMTNVALRHAREEVAAHRASTSWRVTSPLRWLRK